MTFNVSRVLTLSVSSELPSISVNRPIIVLTIIGRVQVDGRVDGWHRLMWLIVVDGHCRPL